MHDNDIAILYISGIHFHSVIPQGVQDGAVAHHVIGERMSRRKSCVKWRRIAGADQTMKRKSGNMKKTWEMKRTKCRDTEKGKHDLAH